MAIDLWLQSVDYGQAVFTGGQMQGSERQRGRRRGAPKTGRD